MADRRVETGVGAFVIFTIAFAALLLVLNNPVTSPFGGGKKTYYVLLDTAPGVGINTPVRKDGITIGQVSAIEAGRDGIKLTIRIDEDVPIYASDECIVKPSSIFGDAIVEFTRGGSQPPPMAPPTSGGSAPGEFQLTPVLLQPSTPPAGNPRAPILLEEKAIIRGRAVPDPISALTQLQTDLGPAVAKLGEAGEKVAILADKINIALGEDIGKQRVQAVMDKLTVALDDFSRVMKGVDEILGDKELRANLRQSIDEFPLLTADARATVNRARATLDNIDQVVANVDSITKPLGDRGEQLAELVISSIENLDVLTSDLSKFAYALNSSEGTIGKLVRDPELYNRASQLLVNVNQVTENTNVVVLRVYEALKDSRKIIDDVRIFTDAIARNPGAIVRGAVDNDIRK